MKTLRCAVYTRKSSEEGLELQFNSLHAQRESCEAYVLSQAGEGWICLPGEYDDGGISGGHLERPGLKALIADVKAGKVDIIVVYKVDRLTRSLTDFSKLVEVFDEHNVSFVSVTQAFNTTNSMGRLTLNVLLSFAQFEREVTGERIRDKIAMSRKRGLWTGGLPPLGYDAINKELIVNENEAKAVRHIFERYSELKNVRLLRAELTKAGYVSKRRLTRLGQPSGGTSFERGALYTILKNRTYLGLTTHKGEAFEGEHDAIVDAEIFERVQRILSSNAKRTKLRTGSKNPSLLAGKITTPEGIVLTPSHAKSGNRRYRYYVEKRSNDAPTLSRRLIRMPAPEIERAVCQALSEYLKHPTAMVDDLGLSQISFDQTSRIKAKARKLADQLASSIFTDTTSAFVMTILDHIILRLEEGLPVGLDIGLNLQALAPTLDVDIDQDLATKVLPVDARLKTCNNGKKIIIGNTATESVQNPALIETIRLAHQIKQRHLGQPKQSIADIADALSLDKRHIWRVLRLAFLAPDIQLSILNGTQPRDLLQKDLLYPSLPFSWDEQHKQFGIAR
jgi:DNA invertase Pin-like site-specific DNA recombinase